MYKSFQMQYHSNWSGNLDAKIASLSALAYISTDQVHIKEGLLLLQKPGIS